MATSPFSYNYPKPAGKNKFNFQPPQRTPTDIVQIGEFTIPGISRVEISRRQKLKEQKKKEGKGDSATNSGSELADVKIITKIFYDDQYSEMEKIIDELEDFFNFNDPKSTTSPAFFIQHPDTRFRRIFNVCIVSIEGPFHYMPAGYTEFIINCKEIIKPKIQKPKTIKTAPQKLIETSTPTNADFSNNLPPSQDPANIQPRRGL